LKNSEDKRKLNQSHLLEKMKNPSVKRPVNVPNTPNTSTNAPEPLVMKPTSVILDELDIETIYSKTCENIAFNKMEDLVCKRIFTADAVSFENEKVSLFSIISNKDFVPKFIAKYQGMSTATVNEQSLLTKSVALDQWMFRFRMKYSVAVVLHKTAIDPSIAIEYKLNGLCRAMETRDIIIKLNMEITKGPLVSVESTF
jgi:hypothetical protein